MDYLGSGKPPGGFMGGGGFLTSYGHCELLHIKTAPGHKDFAGDIICWWSYSDNKSFHTLEQEVITSFGLIQIFRIT